MLHWVVTDRQRPTQPHLVFFFLISFYIFIFNGKSFHVSSLANKSMVVVHFTDLLSSLCRLRFFLHFFAKSGALPAKIYVGGLTVQENRPKIFSFSFLLFILFVYFISVYRLHLCRKFGWPTITYHLIVHVQELCCCCVLALARLIQRLRCMMLLLLMMMLMMIITKWCSLIFPTCNRGWEKRTESSEWDSNKQNTLIYH